MATLSDGIPDNFVQMMVDVHSDMGEIKGFVNAIHDRLDTWEDRCDKRHETMDRAVEKNTSFRHYAKGAIAMVVLFCGYVGWRIDIIWGKIQHALGMS